MSNNPVCPNCGSEPTEESVLDSHLSDLGYEHRDTRYECSDCHERWTVGEPLGDDDNDTWVCGCGGSYVPHFVYVYHDDESVAVKPKCMDCYHVPDEPIRMDASTTDETTRWFVGHHTVTGDRSEATPNTF